MNILFYTIASKRSRDVESQAIEFARKGNAIFLLTQSDDSILHTEFRNRGFFTEYSTRKHRSFIGWVWSEVRHLSDFCTKYRIDLVYAHLEPCSLIAVLCQFIRPKVRFVLCRHHADALEFEANKRGRWLSRLVYRLARHVIVVSANTKNYMIQTERINPDKILVIPLAFNFDLYELPDKALVKSIRDQYPCDVLICTVGRLTSLKRIDKIIETIFFVHELSINAKLIILGDGEEMNYLEHVVKEKKLENKIYFLGFTENVLPFIAAADVYIHLSKSEASCTVVKEAALVNKPVIVCRGVGDFDEYIEDRVSGWLVDSTDCVAQSTEILKDIHNRKYDLNQMGDKLNKKVLEYFNIERVIDHYDFIHNQK